MDLTYYRNLLRISRPLFLLDAALLYALGGGIAHYLGTYSDASIFALGLAWVLTLQIGAHFLYAYFSRSGPLNTGQHNVDGAGGQSDRRLSQEIPLYVGITALTLTTSFTLLLIRSGAAPAAAYLFMGLIVMGAFMVALPPLRLADTLYRGLVPAIVLVNFVPALAFMLQGGGLHRLVSMSTFPLTLLHYAMLLVLEFQSYAQDLKHERATLLVRLGWQSAMSLINVLVLATFTLLGIAMLLGLPSDIAWPAFLSMPLGLFMIWYLTRIAAGVKPHWGALNTTAMLIYGLTAYLLTFSFWTH